MAQGFGWNWGQGQQSKEILVKEASLIIPSNQACTLYNATSYCFSLFPTLIAVGGHGLSDEIMKYSHACTERMLKLWPESFIDIFLNPFLCSWCFIRLVPLMLTGTTCMIAQAFLLRLFCSNYVLLSRTILMHSKAAQSSHCGRKSWFPLGMVTLKRKEKVKSHLLFLVVLPWAPFFRMKVPWQDSREWDRRIRYMFCPACSSVWGRRPMTIL